MNIHVTGKGMKVSDSLEAMIEDKLSKFHRFFGDEAVANVKVQPDRDNIQIEVTLKIDRHYYRAEASAPEALQAMQQAVDLMEGQIRKHKTRIKRQKHQFNYMKEYLAEAVLDGVEETESSQIIRRKSFTILPMDADEAVLQMEMLGHSFLLFLNSETGKVCLVYKRNDGNYGLIEPEY